MVSAGAAVFSGAGAMVLAQDQKGGRRCPVDRRRPFPA